MSEQREQDEGWTKKGQRQEPKPSRDATQYGVRSCRGHWHVVIGLGTEWEDDLWIAGDPFRTEAEARAALARYLSKDDAAHEVDAMSFAAGHGFFAFERKLGEMLTCPTCGHAVNATDSLFATANLPPGASVPAVDPSRSTPKAVAPAAAASSVPVVEPERETLTMLENVVDFAYEHGYHEHGYPLVDTVRQALRAATERAERAEAAMSQSATSSSQTSSSDAALGAALRAALATVPPKHPLWTPCLRIYADHDVDIHAPTGTSANDATRALAALLRSSVHPKTQEEEK
jgi:hypothetical protein